MGRAEKINLTGIEKRPKSIRIRFKYLGKVKKETLCVGGVPLLPTGPNLKYAIEQLKNINKAIDDGNFSYLEYFPNSSNAYDLPDKEEQADMLFDVMDKFIDLYSKKPSTKKQYRSRLNKFWKKSLENQPIANIRYSDILTVLNSGTWNSGKSRNNEVSLIKAVFELAVRDELISENPCSKIERSGYQKPIVDPFDLNEVHLILNNLAQHRPEQTWNFVQFMFFTGLRTSEGLALKWSNVDFWKREALIESANVYNVQTNETKTNVMRIVKLNAMAIEALQRQKTHTFFAGEHIFHDPETRAPWEYQTITDVRRFWKTTLKQVDIRYRRPYNMRHTYATVGLMNGVTPAFMAAQLGHNLRTFFERYAKWINGSQDTKEMEKIEAAITQYSPEIPQAQQRG